MKNLNIGIFILVLFLSSCNSNCLHYLQHIESEDGMYNYCLFTDGIGIGDPGYQVLRLEKEICPKELYINWSWKTGVRVEDLEWLNDREILYNYDEAGLFTKNANIKILNSEYLVFSRGGYYFGLYDLKLDTAIVNDHSPWNSWERNSKNERYDEVKMEKEYGEWIKVNLHEKIENYIIDKHKNGHSYKYPQIHTD